MSYLTNETGTKYKILPAQLTSLSPIKSCFLCFPNVNQIKLITIKLPFFCKTSNLSFSKFIDLKYKINIVETKFTQIQEGKTTRALLTLAKLNPIVMPKSQVHRANWDLG